MNMNHYQKMSCVPLHIELEHMIAGSVVENSKIVSVGQEIGTEVTFDATDSYINNNWEIGE